MSLSQTQPNLDSDPLVFNIFNIFNTRLQVMKHFETILEVFQLFSEGEPTLSERKLGNVMRMIGLNVTQWQVNSLWQQIQEFDTQHSGSIGLAEFILMMQCARESEKQGLLEATVLSPQIVRSTSSAIKELSAVFALYIHEIVPAVEPAEAETPPEAPGGDGVESKCENPWEKPWEKLVVRPLQLTEFSRHVFGSEDGGYFDLKDLLAAERGVSRLSSVSARFRSVLGCRST